MMEIITISIVLSQSFNYAYYLLLMQQLQYKIDKLFKVVIRFKLVNNHFKIKSKINLYNMFNVQDYVYGLLVDRRLRLKDKQIKRDEKKLQIEDEAYNRKDIKNEQNIIKFMLIN